MARSKKTPQEDRFTFHPRDARVIAAHLAGNGCEFQFYKDYSEDLHADTYVFCVKKEDKAILDRAFEFTGMAGAEVICDAWDAVEEARRPVLKAIVAARKGIECRPTADVATAFGMLLGCDGLLSRSLGLLSPPNPFEGDKR